MVNMFYVGQNGELYQGDMQIGDREATKQEIEAYETKQTLAESKRIKDEAKKIGKPYILNGIEYIVPLDKDTQDIVSALTTGYIAAVISNTLTDVTINTVMELSNGVKMPITTADWMAFATWFKDERNGFFV